MRRVDGVLPSGVLSAKYHVAWTRSGRSRYRSRYLYHTYTYLGAFVLAYHSQRRQWRIRGAEWSLHCFEAVRLRPPSMQKK